jgi:hypothetical protein
MPGVGRLGIQLVADAGLALLVLLVITILGVYKPWGRTPYGRRKQQQERIEQIQETGGSTAFTFSDPNNGTIAERLPLGLKIFLAIIAVIVVVFVILHLTGGGLGSHRH